jgi:hypothetical protein
MSENVEKKTNPANSFKWKPDAVFVMNGQEFGTILNAFRIILDSPEAKRVLFALQAKEISENILARAVQDGIVEEVKKEEAPK